ncbi:murein hydrolase activator EnvC family protein [[Eubacterium] hominis]|uniref:murein hydrolase activator EnvC family protein n=1 Tax=[Eubacterium] hominis TaxID=2764325 RepID=UPI003A4E3F1F
MKKVNIVMAASLLCMSVLAAPGSTLYAEDFSDEEYWLSKCSVAQETTQEAQRCASFKEYYAGKSGELEDDINNLNKQISSIQGNIDKIQSTINQQDELIKKIDKQISLNEANLRTIQAEIEKLAVEIKQKTSDIEKRNKIITERMLEGQASIGTNTNIEILMGASDLIDLIRKAEGLQKITESDQKEIDKLKEEKAKLDLAKEEQDRLKQDEEENKKQNESDKASAEEIRKKKQDLLNQYQKEEADLNQKMRSVKANLSELQGNIININTSVASHLDFSGNGTMTSPIKASRSAGTWYYDGGGVHLGMDFAAGVGTPIYAPNDGIILYANNPVGTYDGFLGNWVGWPLGGGNTIMFLTQVGSTTYAVSFAHMAQENFMVSAGQQVSKGQQLGCVGASGNVTGPHSHVEVFNLGSMSMSSAISYFQSNADFAWGTGWGSSALSRICSASGATPCRERPEEIFGY